MGHRVHWRYGPGTWRSLVAHLLWEQGVASSNLAVPIAVFGLFKPNMSRSPAEPVRTHTDDLLALLPRNLPANLPALSTPPFGPPPAPRLPERSRAPGVADDARLEHLELTQGRPGCCGLN